MTVGGRGGGRTGGRRGIDYGLVTLGDGGSIGGEVQRRHVRNHKGKILELLRDSKVSNELDYGCFGCIDCQMVPTSGGGWMDESLVMLRKERGHERNMIFRRRARERLWEKRSGLK